MTDSTFIKSKAYEYLSIAPAATLATHVVLPAVAQYAGHLFSWIQLESAARIVQTSPLAALAVGTVPLFLALQTHQVVQQHFENRSEYKSPILPIDLAVAIGTVTVLSHLLALDFVATCTLSAVGAIAVIMAKGILNAPHAPVHKPLQADLEALTQNVAHLAKEIEKLKTNPQPFPSSPVQDDLSPRLATVEKQLKQVQVAILNLGKRVQEHIQGTEKGPDFRIDVTKHLDTLKKEMDSNFDCVFTNYIHLAEYIMQLEDRQKPLPDKPAASSIDPNQAPTSDDPDQTSASDSDSSSSTSTDFIASSPIAQTPQTPLTPIQRLIFHARAPVPLSPFRLTIPPQINADRALK